MNLTKTFRCSLSTAAILAVGMVCFVLMRKDAPIPGQTAEARPILYIPQATREVECLAPFERHVVPFVVENRGTRRLLVNRLGCSYCGPDSEKQTLMIGPNSTGTLLLTVQPTPSAERYTSKVEFECNDPLTPRFCLTVTGREESNDSLVSAND